MLKTQTVGVLIAFALFSIGFSFLCSILEAVLLSVTPRYIKQENDKGTATGKYLEIYKEDIDRPLSAILTLNTLAHTVGAMMVGAKASELYGGQGFEIAGVEISVEGLIAALMTLAILYASEIIPKTIGANNWKRLSPFTVSVLRVLLFALAPLIWLSQLITKRFKKDKEGSILSRSDIMQMTLEGESSGALQETESTIIKNLLEFEKKTLKDIMTPRKVAFMLPHDTTVSEYMETKEMQTYSRIPIFGKDKDDVLGFVLKDDLILASSNNKGPELLNTFCREMSKLSDTLTLPAMVKGMSKTRQHMHLVCDEYGHVLGLVTMEDVFEELLGHEIMDESDEVADLQALARKNNHLN